MAKSVYQLYIKVIYDLLASPTSFGCPVSCTQSAFDIKLQYFHENAFIQVEDEVNYHSSTFKCAVTDTLSSQHCVITDIFSVPNSDAAIHKAHDHFEE